MPGDEQPEHPPPSAVTVKKTYFQDRFQLLVEDLNCIINEIQRYVNVLKDDFHLKFMVLKIKLESEFQTRTDYLFEKSELLGKLFIDNALENNDNTRKVDRSFNSIDKTLKLITNIKDLLIKIVDLKDSETFFFIANSVVKELEYIKENVDIITKFHIFRLPGLPSECASIWKNYKSVGGCIHGRDIDPVLGNIQKYIDEINRPLLSSTASGIATFLAFVGPSLIGKSQSAFSLAYDQPLFYFNFKSNSQSIYSSFSNAFLAVVERLHEDLKDIRSVKFLSLNGDTLIGAELLFDKLADLPFKTLGLLFGMVEAGLNFDFSNPNDYWLDHYINLNLLFTDKLSINAFRTKFSK